MDVQVGNIVLEEADGDFVAPYSEQRYEETRETNRKSRINP